MSKGWGQAQREASARANMKAAGIPVAPGRSAYGQWRKLSTNDRAQAIAARATAEQSYRAGGSMAGVTAGRPRGGPRRVVEAGGSRIVQTGSKAVFRAEVKAAAAAGRDVVVRATFQTSGGEWRTRRIDSERQLGAGSSGEGSGVRPGRIDAAAGSPRGGQLVEVQTVAPGRGVDAGAFLDYLDEYDEGGEWEALYDAWDGEYGEVR